MAGDFEVPGFFVPPQARVSQMLRNIVVPGSGSHILSQLGVPQLLWLWQGASPPPRQATRVRGDLTCQLALPAQSGAEAVVEDTFPDVEVQRQTVLAGGS